MPGPQSAARLLGPPARRRLLAFGTLMAIAFGLRAYMAVTTAYIFDEDHDHIATAESISLRPLHLPVRVGQHSALTAYFIKAGSWVAGRNPIGYRLFGIVAGMLTIVGVMRLAEEWSGPLAGLVAGMLLTFNEYHIAISALAVEKVYYLAFTVLFLHALTRVLDRGETKYLFLAAVSAGLAFLHKEIAALLIPVAGLALLLTRRQRLLLRWETWAALAVLVLIVSPDLVAQLDSSAVGEADYRTHLRRIEGLGFTYQPLSFFGRSAVRAVLGFLDRPFLDVAPEYPSMNPLMGLVLLTGAVASLGRRPTLRDGRTVTYLCTFWLILGFFLLVQTRSPRPGIDPVAWFWTDITLLPAVILAGRVLASGRGFGIRALSVTAVVASGISLGAVFATRLGTPHVNLGMCPEQIMVPDGSYVPVRAVFHFCFACRDRTSEAVLTDVVESRDGVRESLDGTSLVRGAEVGRTDREFEVLAALSPGEGARWYWFGYEIPGHDERLEAGVGVATQWNNGPAFWTCRADEPEG